MTGFGDLNLNFQFTFMYLGYLSSYVEFKFYAQLS